MQTQGMLCGPCLVDAGRGRERRQGDGDGDVLQVGLYGAFVLDVDVGLPPRSGRPAVDGQRHLSIWVPRLQRKQASGLCVGDAIRKALHPKP